LRFFGLGLLSDGNPPTLVPASWVISNAPPWPALLIR
jgi:hypothetical protein